MGPVQVPVRFGREGETGVTDAGARHPPLVRADRIMTRRINMVLIQG